MSERNCVTHHICDCQRAKMKRLEEKITALEAEEAPAVLAVVEGWAFTLGIDRPLTSQGLTIWPDDKPKGYLSPVTVTITERDVDA